MRLIDYVRPECVVAGVEFAGKEAVLREVARLAKMSPILEAVPEAAILDGLREREALGSTGFGNGIAIPHCRLEGIDDFVVGLISVPAGVDFDAFDGEKVTLVTFIVAPKGKTDSHIRLLSVVSQTLGIPHAMAEMAAQPTAEALRKSFLRYTLDDVAGEERTNKSLLQVFIQKEDLLRDILQALTAAESSSVVVVDAENTAAYLSHMPLFAGLWSDDPKGFNRIIVAVVERRLANEIVRRIEGITGNLDQTHGVMVTIQDLAYAAGVITT